jgi:uncharacterized membrane protein required for colicin V production
MIIAAAGQKMSSWSQNLSFNWFDLALVGILIFGYWRGRKRGMSREALPTTMWLILVVAAGLGYQILGQCLIQAGVIKKLFDASVSENTAAFLISYLAIAFVVFIVFAFIGKGFREKLSGSNTFGTGEYYLGMGAGLVRYACIVIFALALLNAPFYSAAQIAASQAYKARWYGGGEAGFSGNFIPDLSDVQSSVFKGSLTGPAIRNNLGFLLISTTGPLTKSASAAH